MPRNPVRIGLVLAALGGLVGLVVAAAAVLFWLDRNPDQTEQTQGFVDDLYLRIHPKPAAPGEKVHFFVEGEPPISLKAHKFTDLLSADGERLFRLDTALRGEPPPVPIAYPLPEASADPEQTTNLRTRQFVMLPASLEPGRYTLEAHIFGRDRFDEGAAHEGAPSQSFRVVSR